jgi:hypothetical protein
MWLGALVFGITRLCGTLIFPVGVRSESHISRSPWETFWSRRPKHICFIKTWVWFALGSVEDYLMPTWTYISHRLVEISISQTSNYTDNHFCFPAPQHQISFRVAGKCFKPTLPFWWNESAFWLSCLPWCFVKFLPGNVLDFLFNPEKMSWHYSSSKLLNKLDLIVNSYCNDS